MVSRLAPAITWTGPNLIFVSSADSRLGRSHNEAAQSDSINKEEQCEQRCGRQKSSIENLNTSYSSLLFSKWPVGCRILNRPYTETPEWPASQLMRPMEDR